jgi:DNA repair metallo-beta-lactamase
LTGWNDKYNRNLPFYFKVPYSSHSNYRELEKLVRAIQPKNIVFTVPEREMSKKRLEFQRYLIHEYVQKPNRIRSEFDPKTGMLLVPRPGGLGNSKSEGAGQEENKNNGGFGYLCGDANLSERFNPNNKELNTRRFNEANAHILKNR